MVLRRTDGLQYPIQLVVYLLQQADQVGLVRAAADLIPHRLMETVGMPTVIPLEPIAATGFDPMLPETVTTVYGPGAVWTKWHLAFGAANRAGGSEYFPFSTALIAFARTRPMKAAA